MSTDHAIDTETPLKFSVSDHAVGLLQATASGADELKIKQMCGQASRLTLHHPSASSSSSSSSSGEPTKPPETTHGPEPPEDSV